MVEAEGLQAGVDRVGEIIGPGILLGHLGGNPDVFTRQTGSTHGFTDPLLGAIFTGCVDMAVAGLEGVEGNSIVP